MKKALSLTVIIHLCLSCGLGAQNMVTEAETRTAAVHYAQSFLQYNNLSSSNIKTVYSYEEESYTLMREVLFDNGLSILFSAYKSCLPVLLYTTNYSSVLADIESLPAGLLDFMQNYAAAITVAAKDDRNLNVHSDWSLLLNADLSEVVDRSGHIYGPLLTTQWGQDNPNGGVMYNGGIYNAYNYFVESTGSTCSHDTCPTGCVATAMAQIMKYWNYPVYVPNKVEQYDWCNMPDCLYYRTLNLDNGNYDTNANYVMERNAIARLMADCGRAANMHYCMYDCQSFAWPIDARNGLVDTFGYHPDANRQLRSSYSTKTWKRMLIDDLRAGKPILYGGISWKTQDYQLGGHAFVCDGYNESTDKFHFNWGHGGDNNTWCAVDSIIEGNYNWNHLERAVFNIHPGTPQDYCDFEMPLFLHYLQYYNMYGNTTPAPWLNVPLTFTRLTSVPNDPQLPSSWRTIPSGATSEYAAHEEIVLQDGFLAEPGCNFYAHIVPCPSCDSRSEDPFASASSADDSVQGGLRTRHSALRAEPQTNAHTLTVYPNPTNDLLHIELAGGACIANATLYDLQGRTVAGAHAGAPQRGGAATINMRHVPAGVYMLRLTDGEGKEYGRKVVKR